MGSVDSTHHLAENFDPFFTTKDLGKGTGPGSASHKIVTKHNGTITVGIAPEREGTTFRLRFPAMSQ